VEALTKYAVVARYPGATEPVVEDDYHQAVAVAAAVVEWVARCL